MTGMDLDFIARVLELVERSKVSELDLTLGGARLRVVKAQGVSFLAQPVPEAPTPPPPGRTDAFPKAGPATRKLHAVKAGFPGTFYRSPAPGAPPFVSVGDRIEDGRQVAIVEAMKTMNPVEADMAGTIVRVAAEDAQAVEAGDLLFEIEPHG